MAEQLEGEVIGRSGNAAGRTVAADGRGLFASFERLCRVDGGAVALLDASTGASCSRRQLAALVEAASRVIARHAEGAVAGTRVAALQLPNGADLIALVLACWRDGIVPMPVDAQMHPAASDGLCRRVGASVLLRGESLAALGRAPSRGPGEREPGEFLAPHERRSVTPGGAAVRAHAAPSELPPGTALLKVTSGSSGEPRAVVVTADALSAGVAQIMSTMGIGEADVNLVTVPLAHSYAFDNVVLPLALHGVRAVLTRDLVPRQLLATARAARATVFPAVPFLLGLLARTPGDATDLPDLRLVISAGAPLPRSTRESFAARFGVRPRNFYGATECGGIAFDREGEADLPEGCVGSPLDGVTLELEPADYATQTEGNAGGTLGRIVVRSRSLAAGYVAASLEAADADSSETCFAREGFVTADLGRLDGHGRLHLVGRASEVINVGGRKVFPAEVERVIRDVTGVRDVVVLGMARSPTAAALRAVVVAAPGTERSSIAAACRARLAPHKVPRLIELRDEIPRNARGKVDRSRLDG